MCFVLRTLWSVTTLCIVLTAVPFCVIMLRIMTVTAIGRSVITRKMDVPAQIDATAMSREAVAAHVMDGWADYKAGRIIPADEAFAQIRAMLKAKYES